MQADLRELNQKLDRAVFKGVQPYGEGVKFVFELHGKALELEVQPHDGARKADVDLDLDLYLRERR